MTTTPATALPRRTARIVGDRQRTAIVTCLTEREDLASVGVVHPFHRQLRHPSELPIGRRNTHREDHGDALGKQPPRDEAEDLFRDPVQPLGVIDDPPHRLVLGDLSEQVVDGEADEEAIRRLAGLQPERQHDGGASRSRLPRRGSQSCRSAANGSSISHSTPIHRATRQSVAPAQR